MEMNHAPNHMKTAGKISEIHHPHLDYLDQTGTIQYDSQTFQDHMVLTSTHPHNQLGPAAPNHQDPANQVHQWDQQT